MRRKLAIAGVVVVSLLFVGGLLAQPLMMYMTKRHSPFEEVTFERGEFQITVGYCRPYKKGREIFGGLVPYGEVWRTGANEATTFEVNRDVRVAGEPLAAGRYALFTIPGENAWTIVFNNEADQWGAFEYAAVEDALRVDVEPESVDTPVEQFTIVFDETEAGAEMDLIWDATRVSVPIALAKDARADNT